MAREQVALDAVGDLQLLLDPRDRLGVQAGVLERHRGLAGERLGEEHDAWVVTVEFVDQPLPEGERFGVRVVDPEHTNATCAPVADHIGKGMPQLAPGG